MPLPKERDQLVRKRFKDLFVEDYSLLTKYEGKEDITVACHLFITRAKSLARLILDRSRYQEVLDDIRNAEKNSIHNGVYKAFGILAGLKMDYETGMLDDLYKVVETNVTYDYMSQAEQLLGGNRHEFDHVPAAVLAGAVLENALRSLCQRQTPPIPIEKSNGDPKTLDPLITDLQKINVFNKAKADQLRSWAKIRNAAAHGEFTEFDRTQVDEMIPSIKKFLADYL